MIRRRIVTVLLVGGACVAGAAVWIGGVREEAAPLFPAGPRTRTPEAPAPSSGSAEARAAPGGPTWAGLVSLTELELESTVPGEGLFPRIGLAEPERAFLDGNRGRALEILDEIRRTNPGKTPVERFAQDRLRKYVVYFDMHVESGIFFVHYGSPDYRRSDVDGLIARAEAEYRRIAAALGTEIEPPIRIFLHPNENHAVVDFGLTRSEAASRFRVISLTGANEALAHEIAHVVWYGRPRGGLRSFAASEGIAHAMEWNRASFLARRASSYLRRDLVPPVRTFLEERYRKPPWDEEIRARAIGGTFFHFLHETHGETGLRAFVREGDPSSIGTTWDALDRDFRTYLRRFPPRAPPSS